MRQAFHIFLKDTRRSWPFVLVNAAISVALALLAPRWNPLYTPVDPRLNNIIDYLYILLPIAWALTIVQVVQAESLAGDRQFWLTRPYSRCSLIAAKALFCVAFLLAPLFIADCIILQSAGFHPGEMLGGFLLHYALLAAYVILPTAAAAALTHDLRQFTLAFLALLIAFVGTIWLNFQFGHLHYAAHIAPSGGTVRAFLWNWSDALLLAAIALALLTWQYARRSTVPARWIAGLCAAGMCLSSLTPEDAFARPAAGGDSHPEITANLVLNKNHRPFPLTVSTLVQVDLPLQFDGRARKLLGCRVAGFRMTSTAGIQTIDTQQAFPQIRTEPDGDWLEFYFDADRFRKLQTAPVELHALLAVSVYEDAGQATLPVKSGFQSVPYGSRALVRQESGLTYLWVASPFRPSPFRTTYQVQDATGRLLPPMTIDDTDSGDASWLHLSPLTVHVEPSDEKILLPLNRIGVSIQRPVAVLRREVQISAVRLEDYATFPQNSR